jgi:hypothetical protein
MINLNLMLSIAWGVIYFAAILQAAKQYDLNEKSGFRVRKWTWKALPYFLAMFPVISNGHSPKGINFNEVFAWFVFFIALTWTLIYTTRKQWER